MDESIPYMGAYSTITKVLAKMKSAATPPRFTQDYLATTLGFKGGTPRPVVAFLKRVGFLGTDGVPTDLYKRFRNQGESGRAAAEGLRKGYAPLYEVNEYIHDADDETLKGVIVQVTGSDQDSSTVRAIVGSFKALRSFASFNGADPESEKDPVPVELVKSPAEPHSAHSAAPARLGLSYTINLNLPATSDIAVFDAIFKSLKQHLLRG